MKFNGDEVLVEDQLKKIFAENLKSIKNGVNINLSIYGNQIPPERAKEWFTKLWLCYFKPARMSIYVDARGGQRRYNETVFFEKFHDAVGNRKNATFELYDTTGRNRSEVSVCASSSRMYMRLPVEIWQIEKRKIIATYEELFTSMGGCFGFVAHRFDDEIVQNPNDISVYERYGVTDSDFSDVHSIPVLPKQYPHDMTRFDLSYLPGHHQWYDRMVFTVAPYMWFGPDFVTFFSTEKLTGFQNCEENTEIVQGYRRICLWNDISEYNAPIYRNRQWYFRRELQMDSIVQELCKQPFCPKDQNNNSDAMIEFQRGEFSHGGELLAIFYLDEKGRACSKSNAYACVQREMKGNEIVWQEKMNL